MKPLKERIAIEQAFEDGKSLEVDVGITGTYQIYGDDPEPIFYWERNDYRIKLEPIEFWVNVFDKFNGAYAYETEEKAINGASMPPIKTIKVREITE